MARKNPQQTDDDTVLLVKGTTVWAMRPLDEHPGWVAIIALATGAGRSDLVHVTITPALPPGYEDHDENHLLGEHARLHDSAPPPGERITARMLRGVGLADLERSARRYAAFFAQLSWGLEPGSVGDPDRKARGRRGGGDARLARVAARYVALADERDDPVTRLAREEGLARNTVSSYLYRARERGLLTSAGHGRVGGQLTDRGRQLLEQHDQEV